MYLPKEKTSGTFLRAIGNTTNAGRNNKSQNLGFIDNRSDFSKQKNLLGDVHPSQRCFQLANYAAIGNWNNQLTVGTPNWDKRLNRGAGIANADQVRNEMIIRRALQAHGKPHAAGDVVDFAVRNTVEIPLVYIAASPRHIGRVYTPALVALLNTNDIGRILRDAGQDRTAPHSTCFHHHDGDDINSNIIYAKNGGMQFLLGIYGHHMTAQHMAQAGHQATVTAIENRFPAGPWTNIIEHGTVNDAIVYPW